jgi:hypothetical protein
MKFIKELTNRPVYVNGMPVPMEDIGGGYAIIDTDDPVIIESLKGMEAQSRGGVTSATDAQVMELKKKLSERTSQRPSRSISQSRFRVERPMEIVSVAAVDKAPPPPLRLPGQFTRPKSPSPETIKAMAVPGEAPTVIAPAKAVDDEPFTDTLPAKPKPTK